jgi:thioredoxin reductase (NADPH)
LATLGQHARKFGALFKRATARTLHADGGRFVLKTQNEVFSADTVLLATGIVDLLPDVPGVHAAIRRGRVRLCPICDGFEASGQRIAVMGPPASVIGHAKFLRTYSDQVTAVLSEGKLSVSDRTRARRAGISVIDFPNDLRITPRGCTVSRSGETASFDCLYPSLGFEPKCHLAASLGAKVDKQGEIIVSRSMETSLRGLFGAGDAVSGLHQISVATGQAAIAATAIHNRLAAR